MGRHKNISKVFKRLKDPKGLIIAAGRRIKTFFARLLKLAGEHKVWTAVICIAVLLVTITAVNAIRAGRSLENSGLEIRAERRDIEEKISGDTVVEPNNEYSITAAVSGTILSDTFEEGDKVSKDDVLYVIDSSELENNIQSADIAIAKAKKAYDDAVLENNNTYRDTGSASSSLRSAELAVEKAQQSYSDALKAQSDLNIKSNYSGSVSELHVSVGDNITAGTAIADIVDNTSLEIKIPFNAADADNIHAGDAAKVTLTKNGSVIDGVVTAVSTYTESGGGFTLYRKVTIEVRNPGAVSSGDTASAMVGNIACGDTGTFENKTESTITSTVSGEIQSLYISEGSTVSDGQAIAAVKSDTVESQVVSAKLSLDDANEALTRARIQNDSTASSTSLNNNKLSSAVDNAKMSYDDAVLSKERLLKQLEDYTIKAPISGTVVTKNKKAGDDALGSASSASSYASSGGSAAASASSGMTSSSSLSASSSSSAMAVIYDMSRLKCTLNVDEIDVKDVKVGQKVTITTDVTDKEYTGVVETVSVNGTAGSNGVTTYPVKVDIIDFDDALLPGMNIEASIVISSVHDVLAIPTSSLNRGDTVYVKGEKTDESDAAPEGYRTVSVVTGVSDDEYIQIISGLNEGDELYSSVQEMTPAEMMMNMQNNAAGAQSGPGGPGGSGGMGGGM